MGLSSHGLGTLPRTDGSELVGVGTSGACTGIRIDAAGWLAGDLRYVSVSYIKGPASP